MKIFDETYLSDLSARAETNSRRRQHLSIHQSYQEPCQRLFNAIEPDSYIRPHRHATDPRDEFLLAVRGEMALLIFDDSGAVTRVQRFASEKYGPAFAAGIEVPASTWHTVLALQPGSVLLEVKAGPFDPAQPKDLAPWAPEEGSVDATRYLQALVGYVPFRALR
jgi:cupin fold WbuC family metalloprotein